MFVLDEDERKCSTMPSKPEKSIEEIVQGVGRYPLDAFVFVQECLGVAAEKAHNPMTMEEKAVAQWMAHHAIGPDELGSRWDEGDLPPDIQQAIDRIGGPWRLNRHVTGQQLCWAFRDAALERWGMMARAVLTKWNMTRTEDIGAIIFALVDNGWLQKQPTDTLEDFDEVFSFDEVFDRAYRFSDDTSH